MSSAAGAAEGAATAAAGGQSTADFASQQQAALFALCDSYSDVLYAGKPYPGSPGWSADAPDQDMDAVLLHILNHCAKTADVIKRNNDKLTRADPGVQIALGSCCTYGLVAAGCWLGVLSLCTLLDVYQQALGCW
jgi:hypothetical protein